MKKYLIIKRVDDEDSHYDRSVVMNKKASQKFAAAVVDVAKAQGITLEKYLEQNPDAYADYCKLDAPIVVGNRVIR
jgi:hypothetical protein